MYQPGFARNDGWPELNVDQRLLRTIAEQMAAFREGAGPEVDLLLDLNFNFKTEGYLEVAKAVAPYRLMWLEIDSYDPKALALIRSQAAMPVASCESLFGRRQFRPFLDAQAVDVAIVDVPWNGILEGLKIAAMAESYEVNCAPHNFYGHLSTMMSAQFCAAIPNFRIMEIDIDDVPWKDEVVSPPLIEDGHLVLTDAPGWGVEVNEAAIRAHPPKSVSEAGDRHDRHRHRLRARASAAALQPRSPAARDGGARPRRHRRDPAPERVLSDQLQRRRPQGRRAAALCGRDRPRRGPSSRSWWSPTTISRPSSRSRPGSRTSGRSAR